MRRTPAICCIAIGTILLLAALSLAYYNVQESRNSAKAAQDVLTVLQAEIPDATQSAITTTLPSTPDLFMEYESTTTIATEVTMMVDENGYIGIVSIPAIGLALPVMSDWSYPKLKIAPCRYQGTVAGGDLILAGHNYTAHFGRLGRLSGGEEILFTDANGVVHTYEVLEVIEINGADIETMDFGAADVWDLTLFTCTIGGRSRVTVRAISCE